MKNEYADCCFCICIELSYKDRINILQMKLKEINKDVERLKADSQGIGIKKEFNQSCCDCLVM